MGWGSLASDEVLLSVAVPVDEGPEVRPDVYHRLPAEENRPRRREDRLDEPTILLTNDLRSSAKALITRYARRMLIENGLSDSVDFFHLDALSSAVALNVDFDVLLTVIASGVYRILARSLRGFEAAQARQVFRRFLDTTARVTVDGQDVVVNLPRRAHNPLMIDAGLIGPATPIPWWGGRRLRIEIR